MLIRVASSADLNIVAEAFIQVSDYVKSVATNPYLAGLPDVVSPTELALAQRVIEGEQSFALLAESDGQLIGCLVGWIEETSFPPARLGEVGKIIICHVVADYRRQGVASALVASAEQRFLDRGVGMVELSYLAGNDIAETAWARLGYTPFRIWSYKQIFP